MNVSIARIKQRPVRLTTSRKRDVRTQFAALCWRMRGERVEVLVVTSRRTKRWILPKGWPMDGKTDAQAAMQEAWEEAGVKSGEVANNPLASYRGEKKYDDGRTIACQTDVYAVEVTDTKKRFPEANKRDRKWVDIEEAKDLIEDDGMRDALDQL